MNDLITIEKIAKIEGVKLRDDGKWTKIPKDACDVSECEDYYNPLTDDGLCFKLMVKYKIDLVNHENSTEAYFVKKYQGIENWDSVEDENPNKAICLAIIEANKDK